MYLRGSKWKMKKRRPRRSRPWLVSLLVILIGVSLYINYVIVPTIPPPYVPTPTPTLSPEAFISEAEALFNDGKLFQSIEAYKQALRSDPNNANVYIDLARVQVLAGQYADAQSNAELALLRNANNPLAYAILAWALDFQGDYLDAEIAVKKALDIDPDSALAHAVYAEILVDRGGFGDIETAAEESRLALQLGPDMLETHRARGYVLYMTANYQLAVDEIHKALNINDKIPNLYMLLGYIQTVMGEYELALDAFNQANALNPSDPIPDYEASRLHFQFGEFSRAVQYAAQAVKDDPTNSTWHANLGVMYSKNSQPEQAIDELRLAIQGGETEDGERIAGIPLSYENRVIEFYSTYGLTLARNNRCAEAIPIFQGMLSVLRDSELAVYNANEGLTICKIGITSEPESTATP